MQMMRRKTAKDAFPRIPTAAEQAAFERHGKGGPTAEDLRVDVTGQGRRGYWNTAAAYVFAAEYTKLANAACKNVEDVKEAFLTHINALCKQYKQIYRIEEDPEAVANNIRRARQAKVGDIACYCPFTELICLQTAHRRLEVILTTPELYKHWGWFDRLGIDGPHSRDLPAHKPAEMRYIVQKLAWRSKELNDLILAYDFLHLGRRYGRNGRPKPGGLPRLRIRQDKAVDRDAEPIKGLPARCYAKEVLDAMPSEDVRALNIQSSSVSPGFGS